MENWKAAIGYDGLYEISDLGNVRRLGGTPKCKITRGIKPWLVWGYPVVALCKKKCKVHDLVLGAFIGPKPKGYGVNHKDGNKQNNSLANLEYCTQAANQAHAIATGLWNARGEACGRSKLTNEVVLEIRSLGDILSQRKIAKLFSISQVNVGQILRRETWKHLVIIMMLLLLASSALATQYPNFLIYGEDGKLKARCYNTPMATPTPTPCPTDTPTPCPTAGAA